MTDNPVPDMARSRPTFGLGIYTGQAHSASATTWYSDAVPLAQAAESAGFDTFWVSEHHGLDDGYVPAPLIVLAAIASATESIQLGTGVVLGPLQHPIRLAEEAAVLDQLCGGRLLLGLGLGYVDDELRAFDIAGATRGERLETLIEILRLAWSGKRFSYNGGGVNLEDVRVTPRPYEERQIPILLGAYAPTARARAARMADGHLVGRGTAEIIDAAIADLEAAGGPNRSPFTFAINVAAVLEEPGGHPLEAVQAFEVQQRGYELIQRGRNVYSGQIPVVTDTSALMMGEIDAYIQVRGSAEDIVAHCQEVIDSLPPWATPHVAFRLLFAEQDLEHQCERLAAFGERVLAPLRSADLT